MTKEKLMKLVQATNSNIRILDSAIPMALWKEVNTSIYAYAYYRNGREGSVNLVETLYMDYFNNFLTVGAYADYLGINDSEAEEILTYARNEGY